MIVDASVHVWSDDPGRYPWSPVDGVEVPADAALAETLLADLDGAGIDAAVAVQPRSYGYSHAYLAAALADYPDRLAGVCLVDPKSHQAVEHLSRLAHAGFRGVRLFALDEGVNGLAATFADDVVAEAGRLGMPVSLLVDPAHLAAVGPLATAHGQTVIIVDHLGLCAAGTSQQHIEELLALAAKPNIHLRISAMTALSAAGYPFADLAPQIREAYRSFGASRLLWGTDYPHALKAGPYRQSLDAMRVAMPFIRPYDLPAILGGNAARLYHLA